MLEIEVILLVAALFFLGEPLDPPFETSVGVIVGVLETVCFTKAGSQTFSAFMKSVCAVFALVWVSSELSIGFIDDVFLNRTTFPRSGQWKPPETT